jgi:hypothetical protein
MKRQNQKKNQNKNNRPKFPVWKDAQDINSGPNPHRIVRFPGTGIPDEMHMKLVFTDKIVLSTATQQNYDYVGNSCYDPRFTTGGGQPTYFDQFIAMYQQFYVKASQVELQVVNRNQDTYGVCVFPHSKTFVGDYAAAVAQDLNGVSTIIAPAQGDTKRLIAKETTTNALSLPAMDATTWGTSGANPGNLWYWNIVIENLSATASSSGLFLVKIIYDVKFFDRELIEDAFLLAKKKKNFVPSKTNSGPSQK